MRPFSLPAVSKSTVRVLFILIILLCIPAFLINLSLITFIEDEAIRSLVALEMWYNEDYISPTLNNTPYFKKPPLYNWILVLSSVLFGYFGELPARIPTVIFLGLFAFSVYRFYKPKWGLYPAIILSGMLITTGRILFWESLLGLIDMCFSWVIFLIWIALYEYDRTEHYWKLYLSVWLLTVGGFLLKGLPVLVFTGLSVGLWMLVQKQWKKLFHPAQFAGFGLFLLLTGTYYLLFALENDLSVIAEILWDQSSQRTPLEYGIWESVRHIFVFPLEMLYHFLPWSVFLIFLRKRSFWKEIRDDRLLRFHVVIIAGNIWVYWISPEVYPRYLLMFIPFFSALCLTGFFREMKQQSIPYRTVVYIMGSLMIIGTIGLLSPLFIERVADLPNLHLKSFALFLAMAGITYFYFRYTPYRLLTLVGFLIVLRIGFNWFILPPRNDSQWVHHCREQSKEIGESFRDEELYLWQDLHLYYTNSFYISKERKTPLERAYPPMKTGHYYIVHPEDSILTKRNIQLIDSFCVRHEHQFMKVVTIQEQKMNRNHE